MIPVDAVPDVAKFEYLILKATTQLNPVNIWIQLHCDAKYTKPDSAVVKFTPLWKTYKEKYTLVAVIISKKLNQTSCIFPNSLVNLDSKLLGKYKL